MGKGLGIPSEGKVALISVFNKEGIVHIAEELIKMGWFIFSSGGTAKALREAGIKVIDVADLVGGGAILGHRVVTLSREVHAGLLARLDNAEDMAELGGLDIPAIHMVVCDFYPLSAAIAKPGATIESVVEMTDIGGPTMVRSAAKGGRIVICDAADRQWVIDQLRKDGDLTPEQYQTLRAKAEFTAGRYCLDSAQFHGDDTCLTLTGKKNRKLAYAENKCQDPADLYEDGSDDLLAIHRFIVKSGNPSYTALADANGVLEILCTLAEAFRRWKGKVPYIAIAGKHGNPCGAAIDWDDPGPALLKALSGDKVAVMGGEVITNFAISDELGNLLFQPPPNMNIGRDKWGLDLVLAPTFLNGAIELLGKKEKRRLLSNPHLLNLFLPATTWMYKPIRGGFLRQKLYPFILTPQGVKEWINAPLSDADFDTLLIAWAVCWKASSNTVALAKDKMLIGLGCGQQDRIACVRLCLSRANRGGHETNGAIFASDAFFPYATSLPDYEKIFSLRGKILEELQHCDDQSISKEALLARLGKIALQIEALDNREGAELLIDAGCKGGVVTADGQKLAEVKELFQKAGLAVAFVAPEFRGFAKH